MTKSVFVNHQSPSLCLFSPFLIHIFSSSNFSFSHESFTFVLFPCKICSFSSTLWKIIISSTTSSKSTCVLGCPVGGFTGTGVGYRVGVKVGYWVGTWDGTNRGKSLKNIPINVLYKMKFSRNNITSSRTIYAVSMIHPFLYQTIMKANVIFNNVKKI